MRRKQCKIGVLALLLLAEYGFAQTKDSLSKENAIKEVVVVAFGKQKKEEITGSVQSLKAKTFLISKTEISFRESEVK